MLKIRFAVIIWGFENGLPISWRKLEVFISFDWKAKTVNAVGVDERWEQ